MYKPSRFTASALVALQIASFDLYATGGKATLCKCKLTRQAQQLKQRLQQTLQPTVTDDAAIDTLKHTPFVTSGKKHTVEFWRDGKNAWQATVIDAAFGIDLGDFPVRQTDISLEQWALAQDPAWQRQKLHVVLHDKLPHGGLVLIGSKGLKGGGKLWQTLLVGLLGGFVLTNTLDKGLIGYFEGDCPDGWETYGNLTGRVPVGSDGTTYSVGDTGGEKEHTLTINEMPSHNHENGNFKHLLKSDCSLTSSTNPDTSCGEPNVYRSAEILAKGSDQPHNTMQPYLVLNPCKKTKADNYTNQNEFLSLQQQVLAIQQWLNSTNHPTPSPSNPPTKQPTPNNPPIVAQQIPTQYATVDQLFEYIIPSDTFTDPNGDILTLSATLSDGGNLPDWLEFVPDSREFLGYPQSEDTGIIKVKLTAADPDGAQASEVFFLVVRESTSNPTPKPTLEPISSSTLPNSNEEGSTSLFIQNNSTLIGIVSGISGGMCTALCAVGGYLFCKKKNQNSDVRGVEGQHNLGQVVGQGNLNKQIELQVRHKKTVHPNTGRESVGEQLEDDDIEMMYDEVYENKKESTSKKVLEILSEGQDLKPQPPKNTVNQNEDEILRQVLKRSETDH